MWHAIEGTTKTEQSNRFVTATDELRTILLALWTSQGSPIGGYILAHKNGERVNLDNMSKRSIVPALSVSYTHLGATVQAQFLLPPFATSRNR